jgi:glycosyltransferase involved in cell wall biosynthesis
VVDEIWVYSTYVRDTYVQSGVPAQKVVVMPLGIDERRFHPQIKPAEWILTQAPEKYRFLFVGGVTKRKGVDILIQAYLDEFKAQEQVCLVIKDFNFYGKKMAEQIEALSKRTDIAQIIYHKADVNPEELGGIYTCCNCYVHPYRAEGYGLPIAEAMASGLPVIVTGGGAAMDFVDETCGYLIDNKIEKSQACSVDGLDTVSNPYWLIPSYEHLRRLMRFTFNNQAEAKTKGLQGSQKMHKNHTWQIASEIIRQGLLKNAKI